MIRVLVLLGCFSLLACAASSTDGASLGGAPSDPMGSTAGADPSGTASDVDASADTAPGTGGGTPMGGGDTAPGGGTDCESDLALDSADPMDGARAIGLCKQTTEESDEWGVISAAYVSADGTRTLTDFLQVGLMDAFGVNAPRQGARMLALSSGGARAPDQPGYDDNCGEYFSNGSDRWPAGYPRESPACPNAPEPISIFDPAALELRIRVPDDAQELSFETNYFTFEYPSYICSEFNDYFVTFMEPAPAGLSDSNIVFDSGGNWVSVNSTLLQVCAPGNHGGRNFPCPLGTADLAGTGYEGGTPCMSEPAAATGWLRTVAPVTPGSIVTLRFTVWDSDDVNRDSLVLIDNFGFDVEPPATVETVPIII